jgi:2-succinyl-5-enolpyruvyl-6-hydroxy-3-cyclohexene-1-carboxylate synthase
MNSQEALHIYVTAFVDSLAAAGVRNVILCPGSRSTPLAMVFAEQERLTGQIKVWMHLDERSAAYFALGMAKASQQPVAIVCTSGTAAANFMPAVVEAYFARVPLLVLTADRPPELRDVGAAQTIDQARLFGSHVRWYQEMALPEATPDLLRYVRLTAHRAVAEALNVPNGPVHLNFPFREPLVPLRAAESSWYATDPAQAFMPPTRTVPKNDIRTVRDQLLSAPNGLIVLGPLNPFPDVDMREAFRAALLKVAARLDYPILPDVLSQARTLAGDMIIDHYDAFLRDSGFAARVRPDVILRFGAVPTSKPLNQYMSRYPEARHLFVDAGGFRDPLFLATQHIDADAGGFLAQLADTLDANPRTSAWCSLWQTTNQAASEAVTAQVQRYSQTFEGRVFSELAALLPDRAGLYLGSSMPVRDCDTFFPAIEKSLRVFSNRGVNGIDGVVSSALGAGAVTGDPLVLVIGDLSFYHDLNGLLAAKLHHLNATIIVINNDGGGIFSFLPQAAYPDHFEQLYGTPTGLDFSHAAALYGATFQRVTDWESFRESVRTALTHDGLKVIEVPTDRQKNVELHRSIWAAVSRAIAVPNHQS